MDVQRQMESVAAGKSGAWAAFLERAEILRREVPEAPGAEKLLALDLMHELREHLLRLGVKVIIPPSGAMMTDGLEPGGLLAFHPSQLVVEREEATGSGPNAQEAFRRHMDRVRADRERFIKGYRKDVISVEEKHDSPLHQRYEAEDNDGKDMLGVPAPSNYTAAVLRSPVSVPEEIIGLPLRDGRGRAVGAIKNARKEGDKCVVDVTLNADGVALIEQTQRSGPFFNLSRGGRKDGKSEDDPQTVEDEVHHPDIQRAIRERELYESSGVGLPECGHIVPESGASPPPTVDLDAIREAMEKVTMDDIDKAVKGILGNAEPLCDCQEPPVPLIHHVNMAEEEPNPITVYNDGVKATSQPRIIAEDDGEP